MPFGPDLRWLTSAAAASILADRELATLDPLSLARRLRRQLAAERARLVAQQFELRRRGGAKFESAGRMLFTPRGLEQATDEALARYKAGRFPPGAAVADLCCGIGGDLLALASRGPTLGIELDPATAWLAAANLRAATAESTAVSVTFSSTVAAADATRSNLAAAAAWHIDPDRRPTGRRTSQPHRSRPDPPEIEALLAANPNGAVKLSPAARPPNAWETRAELEWLSRQGECRQLVAWFGSLAEQPGRRRATLVDGRGQALRTLAEPAGPVPEPPVAALGPFVFEPDAAVLAAGLSAALAAEHGLARLAPGVAYFTGPEPVSDPALAAFEVLEELPCDGKRLQSVCRQRRVGRIEVKQRGVGLDPARLQAELSGHGELEATLLLHRGVAGMRAILARRCQRGRGG